MAITTTLRPSIALAAATVLVASVGHAAVTPQEAAALGTTLTPLGAEMAGNPAGTIPAYTGGLVPPAGYKPGDARRTDPFADEKPLRAVTAGNMADVSAQLTAGTQEILKRHPTFRVDVYPTHRTVGYPDYLLANTRRNATDAQLAGDGVGLKHALSGIPFPIPKDGREVMWNHRLNYRGRAVLFKYDSWLVDTDGNKMQTSAALSRWEFPVFDPQRTRPLEPDETLFLWKVEYFGPQRRAGEALLLHDAVDPLKQARRAWTYLPGQRRVKQVEMPDEAPHGSSSGAYVNDDAFVYTGMLERFDVKLLGKREVLVPYNTYRLTYHANVDDILRPGHLNPDLLRWELHRVWVVEATLKPGQNHVYSRRVFYVDEDSWVALASDEYDLEGKLRRTVYALLTYSYDVRVPHTMNHVVYDFGTGNYFLAFLPGPYPGVKYVEPAPTSDWSPDALAGAGVR
jgi:hypothetical protein